MVFGNEPLDGSLTIPPSTVYSKENNTFPALVAEPGAYQDSFSNQSSVPVMSFLRPITVQSNHAVTGAGGKVLTCAFPNANIAGNSIVVRVGMGEIEGANITLTITDTLGNVYLQAGSPAQQSTTLEAAIFYSVGSNGKGILAGTNTVTVTIAGSSSVNTGIGVQIDEVFGLITWPGALDQVSTGSNAGSTSVSTGAVVTAVPNELAFVVIASGGGTVTPGANWNNDTGGTLSPVGGNLVSFEAQSRLHTQNTSLTPGATLSGSNAWCAAIATFKTVIVPIQGTVTANAGANLNTSTLALESGGNLAAAKADLDTIVTNTNKIPASPATEGGHLAAIDTATAASKTDLDTIVTNTNKIPTSPATEGGHLAAIDTSTAASKTDLDTLAGIVSSGKAAIKAAANDIVDLATLAGIVSGGRALVGLSTTVLFTTAQTTVGSNNSGDIDVSKLREISIDITMTLITTNLQFFWERKGADGIYYPLWQTAVLTSTTNPISTSVGPGLAYNQSLGTTGRFRWVATGNASFTPNIFGK